MSLLLLAWAGAGGAQVHRDIKISGAGTEKCGQWTAWAADAAAENRKRASQWIIGFIAGHNVYSLRSDRSPPSLQPTIQTIETLVDSFCARNPQAALVEAATDLIRSLGGANAAVAPLRRPEAPTFQGSPRSGQSL